jgi:hypothetical protein
MDVYFNGYGRWANQINEDELEPIGDDYEAGGVFRLRDIDEKTFANNKNFNHVRRLLPSINHDDCEFKKIKDLYHCANPNGDPKFIYMDEHNRNPAFYCMDSYERINSIAIDKAHNPTFLININKYKNITAINTIVIDEDRISVKAQGENKSTTVHIYNNIESPSHLNAPSRKDDWFLVINDMTNVFFGKYQKLPNDAQAWGQLTTVKLEGYVITTDKDRGEDCLNMPGTTPLNKSAFSKRWAKYTANKT